MSAAAIENAADSGPSTTPEETATRPAWAIQAPDAPLGIFAFVGYLAQELAARGAKLAVFLDYLRRDAVEAPRQFQHARDGGQQALFLIAPLRVC